VPKYLRSYKLPNCRLYLQLLTARVGTVPYPPPVQAAYCNES
jgi:hypothetical protein